MIDGQRHTDRGLALQWLEGDERMLARLRAMFLERTPNLVQELEKCLDQGDAGSVERLAHTMMGSAAMMGASALSAEAEKIEQSAIQGDLAAARRLFPLFAAECEKVMRALLEDGGRA